MRSIGAQRSTRRRESANVVIGVGGERGSGRSSIRATRSGVGRRHGDKWLWNRGVREVRCGRLQEYQLRAGQCESQNIINSTKSWSRDHILKEGAPVEHSPAAMFSEEEVEYSALSSSGGG
jgi:hypothetical protein